MKEAAISESITRLSNLLGRVATDADLRDRLLTDPFGILAAEGICITFDDLRELLEIPGASDEEVIEVVQTRLANWFGGCLGSDC